MCLGGCDFSVDPIRPPALETATRASQLSTCLPKLNFNSKVKNKKIQKRKKRINFSYNYRNHRINGDGTGAGRTFMVCDKQQERVFVWVCQKTKIKICAEIY